MAEETALAIMAQDEETARPKDGMRSLVIGLAAVTLLSVAAGVGTAFLIATPAPAPAETAEAGDAAAPTVPVAYAGETGPLALVPLQPVVTNISEPPNAVIRIEASLVLRADQEADGEVLAGQIGADTLAFARSLELAQIEGARGLLHLREDLKERATLRSPAVADLIIHSLVAQ